LGPFSNPSSGWSDTLSKQKRESPMKRVFGTVAFAALLSSAVSAQEANDLATAASERRLTPEQVEAVLAEAAKKREAADKQVPAQILVTEDSAPRVLPAVHGQVGFSVGTGGYREAFGTAVYPLGEDGVAVISLDFVNWGNRRFRY